MNVKDIIGNAGAYTLATALGIGVGTTQPERIEVPKQVIAPVDMGAIRDGVEEAIVGVFEAQTVNLLKAADKAKANANAKPETTYKNRYPPILIKTWNDEFNRGSPRLQAVMQGKIGPNSKHSAIATVLTGLLRRLDREIAIEKAVTNELDEYLRTAQ